MSSIQSWRGGRFFGLSVSLLGAVACETQEGLNESVPAEKSQSDAGEAGPVFERAPATSPPAAETGFIEVPPFTYMLEDGVTRTTARHRVFFTFRPVRHGGPAPLLVVYNGGPRSSSATLLASSPLASRLDFDVPDSPTLMENSDPWIDFASVLVVDAPDAGFSYRVVDDPLTARIDFDPDADASIVLRAVLGFLANHPEYVPRRLGFVGESYGGVRTTLILDRLLDDRGLSTGSTYFDPPLGEAIGTYLHRIWHGPEGMLPGQEELGKHLLQVHLQAVVLGRMQMDCSHELGLSGCPELPLLEGCLPDSPDAYQCDLTFEESLQLALLPDHGIVSPAFFEQLLGVPMTAIPGLAPPEREGAIRGLDSWDIDTSAMVELLGPLAPRDAYYRALFSADLETGLRDSTGDVHAPSDGRIVTRSLSDIFLGHMWHVPAFFSNAGRDLQVRTDLIPLLVDSMDGVSARLDESPRPGITRPGWVEVCSDDDGARCRELRFVPYAEAGHSVTFRASAELSQDLAEWLEQLDDQTE